MASASGEGNRGAVSPPDVGAPRQAGARARPAAQPGKPQVSARRGAGTTSAEQGAMPPALRHPPPRPPALPELLQARPPDAAHRGSPPPAGMRGPRLTSAQRSRGAAGAPALCARRSARLTRAGSGQSLVGGSCGAAAARLLGALRGRTEEAGAGGGERGRGPGPASPSLGLPGPPQRREGRGGRPSPSDPHSRLLPRPTLRPAGRGGADLGGSEGDGEEGPTGPDASLPHTLTAMHAHRQAW